MEVVAYPAVTPTSQQAGTTSDNSEAMTAGAHPAQIPVSSPRPQPQVGYPSGSITWESLSGAK